MSIYGYLSNLFHSDSKKNRGFEMPSFLSKRAISEYDAPELQELFNQNGINFFGDLTDEMLRSFLKYSYPKAIYVIELLGLYGVKFLSEKTKRYSEPCSNDYRLLKFERKPTEISISYNAKYETETVALKHYLSDMRLSTSFLLDGIKLDVLLNHLCIKEDTFEKIFKYNIYPSNILNEIYSDFNESPQNNVSENNKQNNLLQEFPLLSSSLEEEKNQDQFLLETNDLEQSIETLYLSNRSYTALRLYGISTLKELLSLSHAELMNIRNLGKKSVDELLKVQKNLAKTISHEIPSYIANIKLPRPEFSVRLSNSLRNGNITCVKDLLHISKNELLKLPNFGQKCLKELEEYLKTENVFLDVPYIIIEKEIPYEKLSAKIDILCCKIQDYVSSLDADSRKKKVYYARINSKEKIVLQVLADEYSVTRERIRQLELSVLKRLEKILVDNKEILLSIYDKYGKLISYQDIEEFKFLKTYDTVLKNVFDFSEKLPFFIDDTLGVLTFKDVNFEIFSIEETENVYTSLDNIEKELKQRLSSYFKQDSQDSINNYNSILKIFLKYNIDNNFIYEEEEDRYLIKKNVKEPDLLDVAFKALYPSGVYLCQKIDEVYENFKHHYPLINCASPRALEARLRNNENIILTGSGFYQHLDTINIGPEVVSFAVEECKKRLCEDVYPFRLSIIFEKYRTYFERNGISSEYLLCSLLKRLNDPSIHLKGLSVSKNTDEGIRISEAFEEYFRSHKGIIPIEEVKNHFNSLGWDSFRLANQISSSSNIFKISTGYFHKDNFLCNRKKLSILMDKVQAGINECGYVSLDDIRKKNFVDWIEVFNHEDLDARSMSTIIRAYYPECPYDVNSNGLISYGSKLKPYEVLYQWITQKCETEEFVTATDIMDFCEEKNFHRYNTKKQIKDKLAEVADECFVSYDYLGIDNKDAQNVVEQIKNVFEKTTSLYMSMQDLLEIAELPVLVHGSWNEYIVRSIVDNVGGLVFYGFIVINPYQERITRRDHVVANEIVNFTKSWFMETKRLESLLRRNKVFNKNETFSHKSIQNELFGEKSCIEIRDQEKNVCIKLEYREHFE